MSKLRKYMEIIVTGELAGIFVVVLGGWPALGCAVSALVTGLLSRLID